MRNVIFATNISVDGCCDHGKFTGDEPLLEHFAALMREADLLVYGRKTYELMVPYWPDIAKNPSGQTRAEIEFARAFAAVERIVVFSRTLDGAQGRNTRVVRTDPRDEILELRQQPGKSILLGGVELPSQLIQLGLVDEYRFVVHPILVGEGRRLLEGVSLRHGMKLVESKTLGSGRIALRYSRQ